MRHLALALVLCSPLAAQDLGRGLLTLDGSEVALSLTTRDGSGVASLDLERVPTHAASRSYALIGLRPLALELDKFGMRGAVLGVDPNTALLVGPLKVSATGKARVDIDLGKAFAGIRLYAQAIVVDARRQPYVFPSDSASITLGDTQPELILAKNGAALGSIDLVRMRSNGRSLGVLPFVRSIVPQELERTSAAESRMFRDDLPREARLEGIEGLRLSDGSTLLAFEGRERSGVLRISAAGRVELILETEAGHVPEYACATRTHAAFLADNRIFVYRIDRSNWPGTASAIRDVTPGSGLDFEDDSLALGERSLALLDENYGVVLVSLTDGRYLRPVLPPSGGKAPKKFDCEIAMSGDGRVFAFGAGQDEDKKDIYVVRDDGSSVNVSRRPAEYAEVGYSKPGHLVHISLNHDGSLVSWVDITIKDDMNFVSRVDFPKPRLLTNSTVFKCIDIGTTVRMPTTGGNLMIAGQGPTTLDLFFSKTITPNDLIPLTKTGSKNTKPYAEDSKLALVDLASLPGMHHYGLAAKHLDGRDLFYVVDTVAQDARIAASNYLGQGRMLVNAGRLVLATGKGLHFVDPTNPDSDFVKKVDLSGPVRSFSVSNDESIFALSGSPKAARLWHFDTQRGKLLSLTKSAKDLTVVHAGPQTDSAFVIGNEGSRQGVLYRWDASKGLVDLNESGYRAFLQAR